MGSIFDLDAIYDEGKKREYSLSKLQEVLPSLECKPNVPVEYEVTQIKKLCKKLCPMTLGKNVRSESEPPFPLDDKEKSTLLQYLNQSGIEIYADEHEKSDLKNPEERFKYLQFLYYIVMKNRECESIKDLRGKTTPKGKVSTKKLGRSLFDCVLSPSQRYSSMYSKMIREIWEKVSKATLADVEGVNAVRCGAAQSDKGQYDDSIHDLQQSIDLIAQTLSCAYNHGEQALEILEYREHLFLNEMAQLEKESHPKVPLKSCWDELYLRLNYARCTYWEHDLLSAYKEVQKIALTPLPKGHKFGAMRKEMGRASIFENDCILYLDEKTGKIVESREVIADISYDIEPYIEALCTYVKTHVHEIAKKTFRKKNITRSEKRRIVGQLGHVCNYLRVERLRYGRNSTFTKLKLISAFQVMFLALPSSKIAPKKEKTTLAQSPGGLQREKDTWLSSLSNYEEKDPYYLQAICAWVDYQALWNARGSFFAQKYIKTSILALKAILSVDYQSGMAGLQRHTEKVLFSAMKTLISDTDGEEWLRFCIMELQMLGWVVEVNNAISESLLLGKFCKLFNFSKTMALIEHGLNTWKSQLFDFIDLGMATNGAFRIHTLKLGILYNRKTNVYSIQGLNLVDFQTFSIINSI